jgi:hypothetical protein
MRGREGRTALQGAIIGIIVRERPSLFSTSTGKTSGETGPAENDCSISRRHEPQLSLLLCVEPLSMPDLMAKLRAVMGTETRRRARSYTCFVDRTPSYI